MKTFIKLIFGKKGYLYNLYYIHWVIFYKIKAGIIKRAHPQIALLLLKLSSAKSTKISYDKNKQLFLIIEKNHKHYFTNAFRGNWLYEKGLMKRSFELCKSYGIDKISIQKGDIIIDVGANYGDLGIYLNQFGSKLYGFEPDDEPFFALKENNYHKVFKIACSDKKGTAKFYLNSSSADSSLLESKPNQKYKEIITDKLDNLFNDKMKIKLLKIEAEGYEPEVIKGSINILKKTEYICVDGGPERGLEKSQTIEELTNILIQNSFEMVFLNVYKNSGKALFKNKKYNI